MPRAAIYCRVSSEDQGENFSLAAQLESCTRYAEQRGLTVIGTWEDTKSGKTLDRPGLQHVLGLIARGEIDALIVYRLDRFSRNLAQQLTMRERLLQAGVALHCVTSGQAENTANGKMRLNIEGTFAEYERELISERAAAGRRRKVKEGNMLFAHWVTFGYVAGGTRKHPEFVIDPEAADLVRLIFKLYTVDGLSTVQLRRKLSELRIPTPSDRNPNNLKAKVRPVGEWSFSSVHRILSNETYLGRFSWVIGGESFTVSVPAIIDQATWDRACELRSQNKTYSTRNARVAYILRGRVWCSCGAKLTGEQNKQRRFYRCLRRKQNDHYAESVPCKHKASYTAHRLEGAIWHWIDTTVLNEENLRQRLEEQADVIAERRKPLEEELAGYERQLVSLQAQVDRLAELYAAGLYQLDDIAPKKQFLDTARESCKGEIARVKQLLAGMHTAHDRGEHAITLMRQIRANLAAGLTPDDQRKIIDLLDVRAVVGAEGGEQYADVTCQLTLDEARLILAGFVSNAAYRDDNRA